jgi:hypothetical protein
MATISDASEWSFLDDYSQAAKIKGAKDYDRNKSLKVSIG